MKQPKKCDRCEGLSCEDNGIGMGRVQVQEDIQYVTLRPLRVETCKKVKELLNNLPWRKNHPENH